MDDIDTENQGAEYTTDFDPGVDDLDAMKAEAEGDPDGPPKKRRKKLGSRRKPAADLPTDTDEASVPITENDILPEVDEAPDPETDPDAPDAAARKRRKKRFGARKRADKASPLNETAPADEPVSEAATPDTPPVVSSVEETAPEEEPTEYLTEEAIIGEDFMEDYEDNSPDKGNVVNLSRRRKSSKSETSNFSLPPSEVSKGLPFIKPANDAQPTEDIDIEEEDLAELAERDPNSQAPGDLGAHDPTPVSRGRASTVLRSPSPCIPAG